MGIALTKQWTYKDDGTGPEHWCDLCEAFAIAKTGRAQSPININVGETALKTELLPLTYHYKKTEFDCVMTEAKVFHAYPKTDDNFITYNGLKYHLTNWHMHMPSEHQVNGGVYPLEGHLVHTNDQGGIVVMAFFFEIGEEDNKELKGLPETWLRARDKGETGAWTFNPIDFLGKERKNAFVYEGSLTTPPTLECVTWMVWQKPITLGKKQAVNLYDLLYGTIRPVQPLNGRKVTLY